MLFISGSEDPVGEEGRGVLRVFKRLAAAGCSDVSLKIYGGARHEMLNELNRNEVYADLYDWMLGRVNPPA
jgi:alpha-beta hydrolase superfamily lysophospholipase